MNLYYFIQKYLDKLNDVEFKIKWERFFHSKIKRFIITILVLWIIATIVFGYLMNLLVGWFFGIIIMFVFAAYFGYITLVQTLKFLAVNNTRYIQSRINIEEDVINYDNVVG